MLATKFAKQTGPRERAGLFGFAGIVGDGSRKQRDRRRRHQVPSLILRSPGSCRRTKHFGKSVEERFLLAWFELCEVSETPLNGWQTCRRQCHRN
jgi:hypothetical protein